MRKPISDLTILLQSIEPVLQSGVYVYCSVPNETDLHEVDTLATFRETEGITVVLLDSEAQKKGFSVLFRAAWITLNVHSDLQAVGLTAAFTSALGTAGISCNVIAGAYHDHIFVPVEQGQAALTVLQTLQQCGNND